MSFALAISSFRRSTKKSKGFLVRDNNGRTSKKKIYHVSSKDSKVRKTKVKYRKNQAKKTTSQTK